VGALPDWLTAEFANSPVYGDLTRLFRLLDLADASDSTDAIIIDTSALSDRNVVLNHGERRMAQLALLNILKQDTTFFGCGSCRPAMAHHSIASIVGGSARLSGAPQSLTIYAQSPGGRPKSLGAQAAWSQSRLELSGKFNKQAVTAV
jgi:hypothetical protein